MINRSLVRLIGSKSIRFQSTVIASTAPQNVPVDGADKTRTSIHPLSQLNDELSKELVNNHNDAKITFDTLNQKIISLQDKFPNINLERTYSLNGVISKLIKLSLSDSSGIQPYEIIERLSAFHLIRPYHFEILMENYLQKNEYKNVMSLWIKFLSELKNYDTVRNNKLMAMTAVAYLSLEDNVPDLQVLKQLLQLDSNGNKSSSVPINIISNIVKNKSTTAKANFAVILNQYIIENPDWMSKEIENCYSLKDFNFLLSLYQNSGNPDIELIIKFMDKCLELHRPKDAIKIYNDFKSKFEDKSLLNDHLLVVVASLNTNLKSYKLSRIQAIWNDLIKKNSKPTVNSYVSLLRALIIAQNYSEFEKVWQQEVPKDFKENQVLKEAYIESSLSYKNIHFNKIESFLPETIHSIDLVNKILLRIVNDTQLENKPIVFNKYYDNYFKLNPSSGERRFVPNNETLAVQMLANYYFSADKSEFDFMKSISQNSNRNFNQILNIWENFIRSSQNIEPIRKLFKQIAEPMNSKKYKQFIDAEFTKSGGSSEQAEKIFENYVGHLPNSSVSMIEKMYLKELIDSLLIGYCNRILHRKDNKYIRKLKQYYSFSLNLGIKIQNMTVGKMLHTFTIISKENVFKNLSENDISFIEAFLADVAKSKSFEPNQQDIRIIGYSKIKVPQELVKANKNKSVKIEENFDQPQTKSKPVNT